MAVCRIEKTRDYTVMANHHLRNKELSLKAKGLLSLMLSLPEDWDYTVKGLAYICKDGIDSINGTIKELEEQGYDSYGNLVVVHRDIHKLIHANNQKEITYYFGKYGKYINLEKLNKLRKAINNYEIKENVLDNSNAK